MGDRTLDFIALGTLFFVVITLIYGIIYIHDIPYEIAKKKKTSSSGCYSYCGLGQSFSHAHRLAFFMDLGDTV